MTAQIQDRITYEGERMHLGCDIPLPEEHLRVQRIDYHEAGRTNDDVLRPPTEDETILFSTACWRRYVASWRITKGMLYLTGIKGIYVLTGKGALLADWVSGEIRLTGGEIVDYVHMGYMSRFEREIRLELISGRVVEVLEDRHASAVEGRDAEDTDLY